MIKCRKCANKNSNWKVITQYPLQDISDNLPEEYKNKGFKEFYCPNIIEKIGSFENNKRVCGNHILIKIRIFKNNNIYPELEKKTINY